MVGIAKFITSNMQRSDWGFCLPGWRTFMQSFALRKGMLKPP